MTDRLAVTLTTEELAALVATAVRTALAEHGATEDRTRDLASEYMELTDLVTLFHLSKKNGPTTIWHWRRDRGFPAPHRRGGRRVLWLRSEVNAWCDEQGTSGPGAVMAGRRRRRTTTGDQGAIAPQ